MFYVWKEEGHSFLCALYCGHVSIISCRGRVVYYEITKLKLLSSYSLIFRIAYCHHTHNNLSLYLSIFLYLYLHLYLYLYLYLYLHLHLQICYTDTYDVLDQTAGSPLSSPISNNNNNNTNNNNINNINNINNSEVDPTQDVFVSPLSSFLIKRACESKHLANSLFW